MSAFGELSAEILHAGKALRFRAHGTSMHPLVRDGDVLLVHPIKDQLLNVGDIVLCRLPSGSLVVHRVIQWKNGLNGLNLTIQGDSVSEPDGVIALADVYGRVSTIERDDRYIDMRRPLIRLLGRVAAFSSRYQIGRGRQFYYCRRVLKHLPILSIFLT